MPAVSQGTLVTLVIDQGCDFTSDTYVWTDGDGDANGLGGTGNPLTLATTSALARFRSGGKIALTLTDADGITLNRATSGAHMGEYSFTVTHAQSAAMGAGRFDFDLLFTDSVSGITLKAIYGQPFVRATASL